MILGDSYIKRNTVFGEKEILSYETDDFLSIPQKVYKYVDLTTAYARESLKEDYLWFSDPATFNDPFDCKTWFAYHMLADDEVLCRNYYEFHVAKDYPLLSHDKQQMLISHNVQNMLSNKSNVEFFEDMDRQALDFRLNGLKEFGVLCTCMINDNILLWSHYANKHKGICLGLKTDKLLEKYFENGEMGAGEVHYGEFPLITPVHTENQEVILDLFKPMILSKAPFWNYELEYRFTDYPCLHRKKPIGDILDSVYMGFDISADDESFIKEVCKSKGVKLYKSKKVFFKYEIEFVEVDY